MLWPDLNRKIETEFERGILPTMVYINKQSFERGAVRRPLHRHDSICELLLIYRGDRNVSCGRSGISPAGGKCCALQSR